MKKQLTLTLAFSSIIISSVIAQNSCLTGGITFSTQGQVDSFQINNPNCEVILGPVSISGHDIYDLEPLSGITQIGGDLNIYNTWLANLHGLHNLQLVNFTLYIGGNDSLTSFTGLESLKTINPAQVDPYGGATIYIISNPLITNFIGLEGLSPNQSATDFTVSNNASLKNFEGLKFAELLSLTVSGNESLINFEGLESLVWVSYGPLDGGFVRVNDNPNLTNFIGLNNLETVSNGFDIIGNGITNFEGLESLKGIFGTIWYYGHLNIWNNPNLQNLKGLDNLSELAWLSIKGNPSLSSLAGMQSLKSLEIGEWTEFGTPRLHIEGNDSLQNLNGLDSLVLIDEGELFIRNNLALSSLTGIDNIDHMGLDSVVIENNSILITCEVQSICNYFENGGRGNVAANAIGCNSISEIEAACLVPDKHLFKNESVVVYPNPVDDALHIQVSEAIAPSLEISLFDAQGRLVKRQLVSNGHSVQVGELSNGLYLLKIKDREQVYFGKIIKQ